MTGLRQILGWTDSIDPSLSDLHPSLANLDNAQRLINILRDDRYPEGTGFEGNTVICLFSVANFFFSQVLFN